MDADLIAREVVEPTGPAYPGLVQRFGEGVLREDRTLNRAALASIVFNDADALADLNKITHPAINAEIARRVIAESGSGAVVILDAALLFVIPVKMVAKVVVDVEPEIAVARLVAHRGFSEEDAWARIRSQMSREERIAQSDRVVDNSGTPEDLDAEVERLWAWISTLPESGPNPVDDSGEAAPVAT